MILVAALEEDGHWPEALSLHERMVKDMWRHALKGPAAADFMRGLLARLPT